MRILAVSPYYDPEGGGLERYNHQMLRRLAKRGHDVQALAFTRTQASALERDGVNVTLAHPRWVFGNTPVAPGFSRQVRSYIARHTPDIVWAHTPVPFAAEMAYLAARRCSTPFAATFHAGRLHGTSTILEAAARIDAATIHRSMVRHASATIAVSRYVRDNLLAHRRGKHGKNGTASAPVVPPGVDRGLFRPSTRPRRRHDILFVGPLDSSYEWKGVDVLLRAGCLLRRRIPEARIVLVGAGNRFAEYQHCAETHPDALVVRGRLPDALLAEAYRESAVTVLPSTTDAEAFGMVLAEANGTGRPVVGSRIGGIPDFIRDGDNGFLARPGDARDLADKLETILAQPELADDMGQRGLARVTAEHDWDVLAQRTERILEGAARSHGTPLSSDPAET